MCSIVSDDANADDINDANNDASDDTYFPLLPLSLTAVFKSTVLPLKYS